MKKNFEKAKKLLNYKFFPEFIFTILFLFVYLPHFFYAFMPQVLNDTFAYVFQAKDIFDGKLPLENHRMDLPYGYSWFIALILKLGGSFRTVVLFQTVIYFLSFLFLIRSIKRISVLLASMMAIVLWFYCSSTQSLLWNSLIYTESLYSANLVFLTGVLILFYQKKQVRFVYLASLNFLLGIYLRSNGLYLLFVPGVFIIFFYFTNKGLIKHVLFSVGLALLISSSSNMVFKGDYLPGESKRLFYKITGKGEYVDNSSSEKLSRNLEKYKAVFHPPSDTIVERKRINQLWKLATNIANTSFGNHYYYRMPRQIKNYNYNGILNHMKQGNYVLRYKTSDDSYEEQTEFYFTNLDLSQVDTSYMLNELNINKKPRNKWILANHIIDLLMPLHRNWGVVILFYIVVFVSFLKFFKEDLGWNSPWFIICFISAIHLLSIVLLGLLNVSDNAYPRYAYVSEFVPYVVIVLGLYYINQQKEKSYSCKSYLD